MADLQQFVTKLNQCWLEQRYEDLSAYFHSDVVMLLPGGATPQVGVVAMIESYRQFGSSATVHQFDTTGIEIYERGPVAMCHLHFSIDYEVESGRFQESGLDVYAIDVSGQDPRIVWRTQLPGGAGH